ncbi:hypothetical protein [Paenibacillus sp. YIM B09110]|uniref:hypothetical protein n=1 Tax=Paenibacillus sp. YIM B09110 TaxID=3126102 RepID=UPI00301DDC5E
MTPKNIHETQPEKVQTGDVIPNVHYVDENLRSIQQIEGGGPIRKVDLGTLPRPLRIFGYFFISVIVLMGAAVVVISFVR